MAKKSTELTLTVNHDLVRKFQDAAQKKTGIEDFVSEFMVQFLSQDTKTAYQKDLAFFFDFLRSGGVSLLHPSDIQSYHFQLYRDHLIERKLASATVNRRLVVIRSFVKWAVAVKLMTHNPLDAIKLPKVQTEAPTVAFDDEEVVSMVDAPDLSTHKGRTHRLIMVLLFHLGLRRSELTGLQKHQLIVDRGHWILRIKGKGDKTRLMPLNELVQTEVVDYIAYLKDNGVELGPEDFLIQTELGKKNSKPMDGSTIYRVINRYALGLGINKKVSPHSCRATVISHLLDTKQVAMRDVASFAGHANITTTERYDKRRGNLEKSAAYVVDYELKKTGE